MVEEIRLVDPPRMSVLLILILILLLLVIGYRNHDHDHEDEKRKPKRFLDFAISFARNKQLP